MNILSRLAIAIIAFFGLFQSARAELKELLVDKGFENNPSLWIAHSSSASKGAGIATMFPYRGRNYGFVGDINFNSHSSAGYIQHPIIIPENTALVALSFFLNITSAETSENESDQMVISIVDQNNAEVVRIASFSNLKKDPANNESNYSNTIHTASIPSTLWGKSLYLRISAICNSDKYTTFRIDEISLLASIYDPQHHTISVSHSEGGITSVEGIHKYNAGSNIEILAKADGNYFIDKWIINGAVAQNGGESYAIKGLNRDVSMFVQFSGEKHTVTVNTLLNDMQVETQSHKVAHGDSITLEAQVESNTLSERHGGKATLGGFGLNSARFDQWAGDYFSLNQRIGFKVLGNMTILKKLSSIPFGDKLELTPIESGFIAIRVPINNDGARLLILYNSENLDDWNPLRLLTVSERGNMLPVGIFTNNIYYTAFEHRRIKTSPFLKFPLKGLDPKSADVSSIMDHDGKKNGSIRTLRGQVLTVGHQNATGYSDLENSKKEIATTNTARTLDVVAISQAETTGKYAFPFNFKYNEFSVKVDNKVVAITNLVAYDGHGGYDYPYSNYMVIAAADGYIRANGYTPSQGRIEVIHPNGYMTAYQHMKNIPSAITNAMLEKREYLVKQGDELGYSSNVGKAVGAHLHFVVGLIKTNASSDLPLQYTSVDPYGEWLIDETEALKEPLWVDYKSPF